MVTPNYERVRQMVPRGESEIIGTYFMNRFSLSLLVYRASKMTCLDAYRNTDNDELDRPSVF